MSFKHNDNTHNMIHLGNYEEFFVLYIDNELSDDQMKMVDDFLISHPDLQAELEILVSTKLPSESFSINKEDLLAASMKMNTIDEELLLYIDGELTADKKKTVELELAANQEYRLQHQALLSTKLDATEKIAYPDKEELYHRTERRRIGMYVLMRVAAAVVVIAVIGFLYFNNSSDPASQDPSTIAIKKIDQPEIRSNDDNGNDNSDHNPKAPIIGKDDNENSNTIARKQKEKKTLEVKSENLNITNDQQENMVANNDIEKIRPEQKPLQTIDLNQPAITMGNVDITRDNAVLNNLPVTSLDGETYNNTDAITPENVIAGNNETKGSVKGFLRKATRLIEKRTGIDATSDGELLIGVVAVKLK